MVNLTNVCRLLTNRSGVAPTHLGTHALTRQTRFSLNIRCGLALGLLCFLLGLHGTALAQTSTAPPFLFDYRGILRYRWYVFPGDEALKSFNFRSDRDPSFSESLPDSNSITRVSGTFGYNTISYLLSAEAWVGHNGHRQLSPNTALEVFVRSDIPSNLVRVRHEVSGQISTMAAPPNNPTIGSCENDYSCDLGSWHVDPNGSRSFSTQGVYSRIGRDSYTLSAYGTTYYRFTEHSAASTINLASWDAFDRHPEPLYLAGRTTANGKITAWLNVPHIVVQPDALDYGIVKAGQSLQKRLRISNDGPPDTSLQVSLSNPSQPFRIISGGGNFTLAGGASRLVTVEFKPSTYGVYDQSLQIVHNAPRIISSDALSPIIVPLRGRAKVKIKVWMNAFIPKDIPGLTFPAPINFRDQTLMPMLNILPRQEVYGLMTDQRSFSNDPQASYRAHNEIVLETDGHIVAEISQFHDAGWTTIVDRTSGDDSGPLKGSIVASFNDRHTENGVFSARLQGSAEPGLYAWTNLRPVPAIDYVGRMIVDFNTRTVSFSGLTDAFPAYEMDLSYNDGTGMLICQKLPEPGSSPQYSLGWPTFGDPYPLIGSRGF